MSREDLVSALRKIQLTGMAEALDHQLASPTKQKLSFSERLTELIEAERAQRADARVLRFLRSSRIAQPCSLGGLDFASTKGVRRAEILEVANCRWIEMHQNTIVTGPTGIGKSYLAVALAREAVLRDFSTQYFKLPALMDRLRSEEDRGTLPKFRQRLISTKLLVLDDFLVEPLSTRDAQQLRRVIDMRRPHASILVVSIHPVEAWHERIEDETLADSILDHLVQGAYRFDMHGPSKRGKATASTPDGVGASKGMDAKLRSAIRPR